MLAKSHRLPARNRLISPKSLVMTTFFLKYAANDLSHPRVGVVISKKVDKSAVRRNTLRRIIHHSVSPSFPELSSRDLLFIVKPAAGNVSKETFQEEIREALKKIIL